MTDIMCNGKHTRRADQMADEMPTTYAYAVRYFLMRHDPTEHNLA